MKSQRAFRATLLVMAALNAPATPAAWAREPSQTSAGPQSTWAQEAPSATEFPRTLSLATGEFTLYEPQIEDHAGFTQATAWSATAYTPSDGPMTFGAIKFRASLVVDVSNRLVTIFDREILEIKFPELDSAQTSVLAADLRANMRTEPEIMPLDVVLSYVKDEAANSPSVEVSLDPPTIIYATEPTMLVVLDGEAIKAPVKGADGLSIVVNTNWDLFYSESSAAYSILLGRAWLSAPRLDGPWTASKAPEGVGSLPDDARWARVKDAVPGASLPQEGAPHLVFAQAPAELIVTDGPVKLEPIEGTSLSFVSNTSSDIVFNDDDKHYYFLTSGRWFKARSLEGAWSAVTSAPVAFRELPADHPRAHLRASVAGTPEAKLAVAQAQIPQTAEVSRDTKAPDVRYAGEPKFEKIDGSEALRATNTTYDVLWAEGRYYLCHDAVWFVSDNPTGPWVVTDTIPAAIYDIPADSPSHHVTYVKVYETTPNTIYVGYTPGYHYSYVSGGVVVYGSGYYWGAYYNPAYYTHQPYWYYYPYPSTYGQASIYQTATGSYVHGHYAYGPYGGYWAGSRYNPRTGRYGGGVYAWDYDTGVYQGWSYNPRTDVAVSTRQAVEWSGGDSYETWGETVIERDDNWVRAERYGTEEAFRREVETSAGGQAVQVGATENRVTAAKTSDGEIYAGANGNVYRRNDNGEWQARSDGEWTTVDTGDARSEAANRAGESGVNWDSFNSAAERPNASEPSSVRQSSGSFMADRQRLERDRAARTTGRTRYESFRSGRSFSGGGRGRGGGRRR